MNAVFNYAVGFSALCLAVAMLFALIRIFRGPSAQDRVLALDTFSMNGLSMLLILGVRTSSTVYFDMAVLIAMFGCVSTIALAKFLLRGEVIEP